MTNLPPTLFVCGHRKSGTTLFSNLLDGHADMAVYPWDLALLYAYFPVYTKGDYSPAERRDRLEQVLFGNLEQGLGDIGVSDALDVNAMRERFFAGLEDEELTNAGTLICRLLDAYTEIAKQENHPWRVVKETSAEIYAGEIQSWFPEARFLQIIRDPRDVCAALFAGVDNYYEHLGEGTEETLASLIYRGVLGMKMADVNRKRFGDGAYKVTRFEDLAENPESVMKDVCAFLGIDYSPALTSPTALGQPVAGNNLDGEAMPVVTGKNVGRWRDRLRPAEAQVIEFHFAEDMARWGYETEFSEDERAQAAAEFYKWSNYRYFYSDRFEKGITPPKPSLNKEGKG